MAPSKQLNKKNKHEFSNSKEFSSISSSQVVTNDHEISSLKTLLERLKAENERLQHSEMDELSSHQQIQKKLKFTKKHKNTTLSDSESETKKKLLPQKTPIAKPPSLNWYNLSEILMYKANNLDFPECINNWAIKMMVHRSINQQCKKEHDATKSNNNSQITERETMALSDDEYLDQEHSSELTIERSPIVDKESMTNVNTSNPKKRSTKKHPASTLPGLKSLQAITSDKMNEECSEKVISNNRQGKKIKTSKNK
ncbi:7754_t:CDS:2, partial [Gigaspora margarita]